MSTSLHTPGPWEARYQDYGFDIWGPLGEDPRAWVCPVRLISSPHFKIHDGPDSQRDYLECKANAQLIAAAPDLLSALTALVDVQNGPPLIEYTDQWNAIMDLARAAIAKVDLSLSPPQSSTRRAV